MPITSSGQFVWGPSEAAGSYFGGGGGSQAPYGQLAQWLLSQGFNIPPYTSGRKFGKMTLLSELLGQIGAPTGLEDMFGPEYQANLTRSTLAQTSAPFQEAGRMLQQRLAGAGQGFGGQTMAAQAQLGRAQGQTQAGAIAQMLAGIEGQRAGNISQMESIRQSRQGMLANYLSGLQTQHFGGEQMRAQRDAMIGQGVGQGVGGIASLLAMLSMGCWVAEASLGADDPDFPYARLYLNVLAPGDLRALYYAQGRALASVVRRERALAARLAPVFRSWAGTARAIFGG